MKEADWLVSTNSGEMLDFCKGRLGERKIRLFLVACCRRIWEYLKDKRSRRLVEVAERYADGEATLKQLDTAFNRAGEAQEDIHLGGGGATDQSAAEAVLGLRPELQLGQVFEGIAEAVGEASTKRFSC